MGQRQTGRFAAAETEIPAELAKAIDDGDLLETRRLEVPGLEGAVQQLAEVRAENLFDDLVRSAEAEAPESSQEVEPIDDGEVDEDGRVRQDDGRRLAAGHRSVPGEEDLVILLVVQKAQAVEEVVDLGFGGIDEAAELVELAAADLAPPVRFEGEAEEA